MILRYLYFYELNKYDAGIFLRWLFPRYFKVYGFKSINVNWNTKNRILFFLTILLGVILLSGISLLKINLIIKIIIILFIIFNNFILLIISGEIINIIEKKQYKKQIIDLKNKFEILNSIKLIGVAGSSGKTSVISILEKILPNNICINDFIYPDDKNFLKFIEKNINKNHKYFIYELNSYKKNQIEKFCRVIKPDVGIITNINERQLKYFDSLQNSIDSKFELLQNLKQNGLAIVNLDNNLILENLKNIKALKIIGLTFENKNHDLCQYVVSANNIKKEDNITFFDLKILDKQLVISTKLVGKYNLYNLVSAIICVTELGIDNEKIITKISQLENFPHQFQFNRFHNLNFIDNINGNNISDFKEALKILNTFEGKKVIVTPGISEIGKKSKQIHIMLGDLCSKICDWIILVGENDKTNSIRDGALKVRYPKNKIVRVKNFKEAYRFVHKVLPPDSTVLFESSPDGEYE